MGKLKCINVWHDLLFCTNMWNKAFYNVNDINHQKFFKISELTVDSVVGDSPLVTVIRDAGFNARL